MWYELAPERLELDKQLIAADPHYQALRLIQDPDTGALSWRGWLVNEWPSGLRDRVEIEVVYPSDYPASLPAIRDVAGRFPVKDDAHVFKGSYLCWTLPERKELDLGKDDTIVDLLDEVAIFIRKEFIYLRTGPWPGEAEPHGLEAVRRFFYEKTFGGDDAATRARLQTIENRPLPGRNSPCPCDSGRKFKLCHLRYMEMIRRDRRFYVRVAEKCDASRAAG